MPVERVRRHRHRMAAVRHLHERDGALLIPGLRLLIPGLRLLIPGLTRDLLAHDCDSPLGNRLADILVSVGGEAADGDEQGAGRHGPGVPGDGGDVDVLRAADFHGSDILYEFFQFHFKVSRMVSPFLRSAPGAGFWAVTWPVPS